MKIGMAVTATTVTGEYLLSNTASVPKESPTMDRLCDRFEYLVGKYAKTIDRLVDILVVRPLYNASEYGTSSEATPDVPEPVQAILPLPESIAISLDALERLNCELNELCDHIEQYIGCRKLFSV